MKKQEYLELKNKIKTFRDLEEQLKKSLGYCSEAYEEKLNELALFQLIGESRNFKVDASPILKAKAYEDIARYAKTYTDHADELSLKEIKDGVRYLLPYLGADEIERRKGIKYHIGDILDGNKIILRTWIDDAFGEKSISYSALEHLNAFDKFLDVVLNDKSPKDAQPCVLNWGYGGRIKESDGIFEPMYIEGGIRVKIFKNGKLELKFDDPKKAEKVAQAVLS